MGFSDTRQDITAAVKEQTDIVRIIGEHVDLKKSGVRYLGLCPFHGEKTPSFSVHGTEQFYYCFGCGESGDVFSFLMKYHNYDFPTALKTLADRLNIELPEKRISAQEREKEKRRKFLYDVSEKAARIYAGYLREAEASSVAWRYLEKRGISKESVERFRIGYAPSKEVAGWNFLGAQLSAQEAEAAEEVGLVVRGDRGRYDRFRDRILFPIHDVQGKVCGFGGRIVGEGQPKYMNSPESQVFNKSRNLLGLYQGRDVIRRSRKVVLVEGNFDLLALVENGMENVVAPLGTALTESQVRLLGRYADEVTLLFDGDEAGIKAAIRAAPHFLGEKVAARVALLPDGHDPDTFVRQEGTDRLKTLLEEAEELSEFVLAHLIAEHGLSLEGKSRIVEEIRPIIEAAASPLQRSMMVSHFGEKLGIDPGLLDGVGAAKTRPAGEARNRSQIKPAGPSSSPLTAAQKRLIEFMLMYPEHFQELASCNLRDVLQGGMGEILFLQMQEMLGRDREVQPEDVFAALPDGAERNLVADMLMQVGDGEGKDDAIVREELAELLEWLDIWTKKNRAGELMVKIEQAQKESDFQTLERLLREKQELERQMRAHRP